ncbi:nitroreductase [Ramlibacter sp. H39-3-26]|uniref:nitroreductase n=1 Tax=Curvibacter soli TaxID=3031331 RepID=UPI0023D9881D|nr:nitroreductase [Ramlibacter sp. H39-3-26]MDF1484310.1 nitroreductase [Ramlibacter sp. H39-3-26]
MDIREAVASRLSVRDFLPDPVPHATIARVLQQALRAPSGGNLQPWHLQVVGGAALVRLKAAMHEATAEGAAREAPAYDVYPRELASPYRERRFQVGEDMYARLGIAREDKPARRAWFRRNAQAFGAPLVVFCSVDRRMGPPQWSDLGMLLQTFMLLLRAEGLHSCAQEYWSAFPETVGSFLALPPERMLFAGVAVGHVNMEHPVNRLVTARATLDEVAQFIYE